MTHTQAEWLIADEDKSFVYALGPGGTNLFWAQVQAAGPEKISAEEKASNARLIAAAPDLLDALQEAKHMFAGEYPGHPTTERIFAAIQKATGAPA